MKAKQINLACIASGSGTDFESIAQAWKNGWLPEIEEVVLISTKQDTGCIEKANKLGINYQVYLPLSGKGLSESDLYRLEIDFGKKIDLIFLVGCIVFVPDIGSPMYNIHPADPEKHGGQGMYGLKVHLHVLAEIKDQVERGMAKLTDRFFTTPVVHEASREYDQGRELLRASVEIPYDLVQSWVTGTYKGSDEDIAKRLQQIVLPYEWQMLPCAVRLAARKTLDER
jgi:folate-dependent phosphoribosylglycinamide formyltransferase PurN